MKVEKVLAYKSSDGSIYLTEKEAVNDNITTLMANANVIDLEIELKKWFKEKPKDIKYILANIDKIDVE